MSLRPIFHDPSGRRGRVLRIAIVGAASAVFLLVGTFAINVLNPPVIEPLPMRSALLSSTVDRRSSVRPVGPVGPLSNCQSACAVAPMPAPRHKGTAVVDPIVAAFVVQWDPGSRASLKRNGSRIDWVIVEGAFLGRGAPGEITVSIDPDLLNVARSANTAVHLMLTNFGASAFDSTLVMSVVGTAERRTHAVAQLADVVKSKRLRGVTVDFELVPAMAHPQVIAFVDELRRALQPLNAVVSVAVPISVGDGYPLSAYAAVSDYVIPMLYDENSGNNEPGPIASAAWFAERLDTVLATIPAGKVLIGVGQYGYHWRSDQRESPPVSVSEAMALSRAANGGPRFHATARNPHATWKDANSVQHTVWYLDAATAWNQLKVASASGVAGMALWRLGSEDATLWRVLDRTGLTGTPDSLRALPNDAVAIISGEGEVLAVEGHNGTGLRSLRTDTAGFIFSETTERSPGGYLVSRAGVTGNRVALTFDDGPDAEFTGQILDTLKSRNAVASFFVVGRQVQHLPALARRIANEGHEIGNHSWSHPDLSSMSESAIKVEIAATGRVIEAVTGVRPRLFRPPYIGDARPSTPERLRPMAVANELGYRVAALEIDTKDWFETEPAVVVATAMQAVRRGAGRVILLHDAGGDRSSTIAAVGPLIDSLRASGYQLSTIAAMLNEEASGAMMAPADEASERMLTSAMLRVADIVETFLVGAFLVALVLGVARLFAIGGLAAAQRFMPRYARRERDAKYLPAVTVIVPAYNESRVIARTVMSVLAQEYPLLQLLVVDDGSSDDTSEQAAVNDARVRVVRQANAGKAAAINNGISHATGDIIVVIDGDTLLAPHAIRHLVRPLADERVGAVAGNAKVGNRVNLVTKWQAVEYVTSQNLDRRAFVMLNSITVVPGAIGAWRRSSVVAAGGFCTDTLAEDQDLTLTLLRQGHRVALADQAIAYTEAPETFDALLKQRFRWSFGTLQCAWKHRAALLQPRAGALGMVGLPNIWLFQLLFPLLAPAADVALLATLVRFGVESPVLGAHVAWSHAQPVLALYAFFLLIDTITALLGVAFEPGEKLSQALLVPLQRVAYRQVLYIALVRAIRAALNGRAQGWGKLERTGRVHQTASEREQLALAG